MITNNIYEITKADAANLSAEAVRTLYSLDDFMAEKYGFLKRYRNVEEYKRSLSNVMFIVSNNSLPCGILNFIQSADWSGKEQYQLTICLSESVIELALIECLCQFINEKLEQHGQIAMVVFNDELAELLEKYSCKVQLKAGAYTLNKADIDANVLTESIAEYQARNNDLRMVYTNVISEEHIQQYCDLFNELQEDMPDVKEEGFVQYVITPEKQKRLNETMASRNNAHHCFMIFNTNGVMVAKTNVSVNNNDPRFPYQFMIGVKKQYRGRGIGKWLYAAMYKKLLEDVNFEKVLVRHHPENKHAISISEWVGYKLNYFETIYVVDIKV